MGLASPGPRSPIAPGLEVCRFHWRGRRVMGRLEQQVLIHFELVHGLLQLVELALPLRWANSCRKASTRSFSLSRLPSRSLM